MDLYFSEREKGQAPRDSEEISDVFWKGFIALVETRLRDGSLAKAFSQRCIETPYPVDCNVVLLRYAIQGEVLGFPWPMKADEAPETLTVLDAVEFFGRHVLKVTASSDHPYRQHDHLLEFDREKGFSEYRDAVNRLFRRCRHPFELREDGCVQRIAPEVLREVILTDLRTGDTELDRLISAAVQKFKSPDPEVRDEALEKLWDAWERLKTLLDSDKKKGIAALLESAVESEEFRGKIDEEARALTNIGNQFMIRHTEADRTPITRAIDVDYLFHRLYALIRLLVKGAAGGVYR